MTDSKFPVPPSHKTFDFGQVVIDSNFDSGNCSNAEKVSNTNFNIWIGVDHPKNQYRTWFYFSLKGLGKSTIVNFNIKNHQNQSRLLSEGLVPVYREQNSSQWKRILHRVDLSKIEFNEGWIEWSFKHTMTSDQKVYFAFFYPWSNLDNHLFLSEVEEKCKSNPEIYFKRSNIINTLEGRPVQFLTVSSKKGLTNKDQKIEDAFLFPNGDRPKQFQGDKKCIVIGARVHPGEVPGSHVMTGIIKQLISSSDEAKILRDKFVFYIFPIFNPDGVARGHYRVDTNGINLNRCYINPSPKFHMPIYAVKKIICHLHAQGKYFAFLDLHAHAARKGIFIYGNSSNELQKQVDTCLFAKILSMNSEHFEYEGSNFTQKNMYCKDKNDHASKEGAGRVALFKSTKNPNSWTIQCNYNTSRVLNILQPRREAETPTQIINEKSLDPETIINYRSPVTKEAKEFYSIETYHQLGKEICESILDFIGLNPHSRIDNPKNHFKNIQNLKLNLAIALLRMAPNRFQSCFRRIYSMIEGSEIIKQRSNRAIKALYLLLIRKAKIQNLNSFLKDSDDSGITFPQELRTMSPVIRPRATVKISTKKTMSLSKPLKSSRIAEQVEEDIQKWSKQIKNEFKNDDSNSDEEVKIFETFEKKLYQKLAQENYQENVKLNIKSNGNYQRIFIKPSEITLQNVKEYRRLINSQTNKKAYNSQQSAVKIVKVYRGNIQQKESPGIMEAKIKPLSITALGNELKLIRHGNSAKEEVHSLNFL